MIQICAMQLRVQLQHTLSWCYLLLGNDALLLQESLEYILDLARSQQFTEHISFQLDSDTNWNNIFSMFQERSLFSSRQVLQLFIPNGVIDTAIADGLIQLALLLHNDLLLIICCSRVTRSFKKNNWFQAFSKKKAVLVSCIAPTELELYRWVTKRTANMNMMIDHKSCQLLCYYYEGNLLALVQLLEQLYVFYPDHILTTARIEKVVNDSARFMPFHWVDAVISGKSRRSLHILRQLRLESAEPLILLRSIQRDVLILLNLKRLSANNRTAVLFNRYKVWLVRRALFMQALDRLTLAQLRDAVNLMIKIELALKIEYSDSLWSDLSSLSLLLCGRSIPEIMFNA